MEKRLVLLTQSLFSDAVPMILDTADDTPKVEVKVLDTLGEGGFGTVLKVMKVNNDKTFAAKRVFESLELCEVVDKSSGYREAQILKKLNSETEQDYVIKFFGLYFIEVSSNRYHVLLFLEHLPTDLQCFLERNRMVAYNDIINIVKQILQAVSYIHSKGIIHCDLKPNNILVNKSQDANTLCKIKIADFGIGVDVVGGSEVPYTLAFTLSFQPPESILRIPFSFSADIWAVGCIIYEMICNKPLFASYSVRSHIKRITEVTGKPSLSEWLELRSGYNWEEWDGTKTDDWIYPQMNHQVLNLFRQMVAFIPSHRITAQEALHHDIFTNPLRF